MTETKQLYSTLIANCVFNAFLSYTAIALNIITIQALRKTPSLPKSLKTLLLSLAVSDLGVGLLVQPLNTALLVMEIRQYTVNSIFNLVHTAHRLPANLLSFASFFGVVALTVDRVLAIHLHLRYQELVTHKRVVAVVISTWLLSAFLASLDFTAIKVQVLNIKFTTVWAFCFIVTGLLYCKMYAAVRRHAEQIRALQVPHTFSGKMKNSARLRKSVADTFYVYAVFLTCYLPCFCTHVAFIVFGVSTLLLHLWYYSLSLICLNSSLNPLIYCWKMRHIRQAVLGILRNIFPTGH